MWQGLGHARSEGEVYCFGGLHNLGKLSAGILLYRRTSGEVEVLLIHPGGPFWRGRGQGAWMIPKGGVEEGEDIAACALREFEEELGTRPAGEPRPLCRIRQAGGKWVEAFVLEGDLDADRIVSNEFTIEWPPRSGEMQSYPEVDRAAWFSLAEARALILPSQAPILDALEASLA
jgi:predicted NUDIX family NTP pyrophosphohydrolase